MPALWACKVVSVLVSAVVVSVVDVVVVVEATKVVKTVAISRTRVELLVDLRTIRQ